MKWVVGFVVLVGIFMVGLVNDRENRGRPHFVDKAREVRDLKRGESACTIYVYGSEEHGVWVSRTGVTEECEYWSGRAKVEHLVDGRWRVRVGRPLEARGSDEWYGEAGYIRADEVVWAW